MKSTDFEPTDRNDIVSSLLRIAFESVKAEQSSPTARPIAAVFSRNFGGI